MATYTDNYALVKPTYGELADVAVINGNMDTIDGIMHSNRTMLAPAFSQTEDYAEGDVVVYEGNLYRFIVPHTAGNWDGTEVEQTTLGEEVSTKGGADVTKTASGNPIEITDGANAPLVKCVTAIQGNQDLHGYDKPWVGGAGKNKLPSCVNGTYSSNGITITVNDDLITVTGQMSVAQVTYIDIPLQSAMSISSGLYVHLRNTEIHKNTVLDFSGYTILTNSLNKIGQLSNNLSHNAIRFFCNASATEAFNMTMQISIEADSTTTDFTPYSNICPITAYTEGEIEVSDGDGNTTTHTTTYPSAIYRGSEDVVNGTVGAGSDGEEWIFFEFDGSVDEDWGVWDNGKRAVITLPTAPYYVSGSTVSQIICNQYKATTANNTFAGVMGVANDSSRLYVCDGTGAMVLGDFKTWLSNNPLQIAYKVKTPTTSSVTPTNLPIKSLSGYTHIESSTGDMEVEYITEEFQPIVDLIESNSGKHVYSTQEQVVGTWTDGSTLYQKTIIFDNVITLASDTFTDVYDLSTLGVKYLIELTAYTDNTTPYRPFGHYFTDITSANVLRLNPVGNGWQIGGMTIRYTKSTPTRSLNLTKSAVEEIPEEIKNAPFEEKPDYNEADDDAPTEANER